MEKATIGDVRSAFESSSGDLSPQLIIVTFVILTFGIFIVFAIYIVLKKASRGGEEKEREELFKIISIVMISIGAILLFLYVATA